VEDRYYLLQAVTNKEGSKKGIVEGWVFGAKINVVNIANPAKKGGMEDDYADEDNEDEKDMGKETTINPEPKKNVKPTPSKKDPKDSDYYEEDEDEDD
jgi:hypothetical protein